MRAERGRQRHVARADRRHGGRMPSVAAPPSKVSPIRVAGIFVPVVLAVAVLTFVIVAVAWAGAKARARAGQRRGGPHHRLPLRPRTGHADVRHGGRRCAAPR